MTEKSEALRLAEFCDGNVLYHSAAAELRRLHAVNAELLEALKRIADPRNIHFAGDAQVVARAAIARAEGELNERP